MSSPEKLVLTEDRESIRHLIINRPQDRNSINTPLMLALESALVQTEAEGFRAAILSGAGDAYFVGGADGVEMMQCDIAGAQTFSARIQTLFNRMEQSPLILAAAIDGLCFGGGFELAMACDLRFAAETARIGLPEVKVGLIPGGGGTQRLPRLVGTGRAMEIILSGQLYTGSEALGLGLVNQVAPADQLMELVHERLAKILRNPVYALPLAKKAILASRGASLPEGLKNERCCFGECFQTRFFRDLMVEQLKSGTLQTSDKLPEDLLR